MPQPSLGRFNEERPGLLLLGDGFPDAVSFDVPGGLLGKALRLLQVRDGLRMKPRAFEDTNGVAGFMGGLLEQLPGELAFASRVQTSLEKIEDVSFNLSSRYKFAKHWSFTGQLRYEHLLEEAADSPIVNNVGSENNFVVGLGLNYTF